MKGVKKVSVKMICLREAEIMAFAQEMAWAETEKFLSQKGAIEPLVIKIK